MKQKTEPVHSRHQPPNQPPHRPLILEFFVSHVMQYIYANAFSCLFIFSDKKSALLIASDFCAGVILIFKKAREEGIKKR